MAAGSAAERAARYDKVADRARERHSGLTTEHDGLASRSRTIQRETDQAERQIDRAKTELESAEQGVEGVERWRARFIEQLEHAEKTGDAALAASTRTDLDRTDAQIAEGRRIVESKRAEIDGALERVSGLADESRRASERMSDIDNELTGMKSGADTLAVAAEFLRGSDRLRAMEHRAGDLKDVLRNEADRFDDLRREAAEQQSTAFKQVEETEGRLDALKGERSISQKMRDQLARDVERAEGGGNTYEASRLRKELSWREDRLSVLQNQIKSDTAKVGELRGQSNVLHQSASEYKAHADELRRLSTLKPDEARDRLAKVADATETKGENWHPAEFETALTEQLESVATQAPVPSQGTSSADVVADGSPDAQPGQDQLASEDPAASLDEIDGEPVEGREAVAASTADASLDADPARLDELETEDASRAAASSDGIAAVDLRQTESIAIDDIETPAQSSEIGSADGDLAAISSDIDGSMQGVPDQGESGDGDLVTVPAAFEEPESFTADASAAAEEAEGADPDAELESQEPGLVG